MNQFRIEGGFPAKGRIRASGNKNAALPCIAATILSDEPVILRNIPEIQDVKVIFEVLESIGVEVQREQHGVYRVHASNITTSSIPAQQAARIRASILLAGPMLARTGRITLPPPGGDVIGRRRLDTHFLALRGLGAHLEADGVFYLRANKLVGDTLFLDEASVTATENAIMAAVLSEGRTVIENAASEPHVQDLCRMLESMGASISGIGSNILTIDGVSKLHGTDFRIGSDYMEIGSLIGLAAITRGDLIIDDAQPDHLKMIRLAFNKLGIHWERDGESIHIASGQSLTVVPDIGGMIPRIDDSPWPGFPADLISIMIVVATQAVGTTLMHEKMYESRMYFVDRLIEMGARIILCDPHRAVVSGPSRLRGSELVSPDVRAGMAMLIAALSAEGTSVISNVYQIERGYEDLCGRLQGLGLRIERQND
ncbi:MAG: UDP-N-acetylglucosamine 1-carboxyvinyltransferase [Spirochaetales bacterium]